MTVVCSVFRNGDELFKGIKFVLSRRDLYNWDQVSRRVPQPVVPLLPEHPGHLSQLLTLIGDKIQLRTGAARK